MIKLHTELQKLLCRKLSGENSPARNLETAIKNYNFIGAYSAVFFKNYITLFLLILAFFSAGKVRAERLPLKFYCSADGLASSAVFQVKRDSRGFLWFTTRDGLSRFDGREFVNYRLENQTNSSAFNATLETRDGSFWISASGGLFRVRPDEASESLGEETPSETNPYKIIRAERVSENTHAVLFEDSRGRIRGGDNKFTLIVEKGEIKSQPFDLGALARTGREASVNTITEGGDGSLWVGCDGGAMRILPDNWRVLYPIRG